MKRKIEIGIALIVLVMAAMIVSALTTPYSLGGHIYDKASTAIVGANITFTNQRTEEIIYWTSTSGGEYSADAANFPSGYKNGDVIQYYVVYGSKTNTTTAPIDTSQGGTLLDIILEDGGNPIQDPYPLDGYVKFANGTKVAGANITFTNQRTGEVIYDTSSDSGWYSDDAANFPSGYQNGDVIRYYTVYDGYENTTSHTIVTFPEGPGYNTMDIILHPSTFDTGKGTYPSIFGVHNGTIKPSQAINVSKLYTYPCTGTGGHSEYVWIHENGINVSASWDGYQGAGDYHYIEFSEPFTLEANVTYNYTIKTGSYPQIHHTDRLETDDGVITCDNFVDANGKVYTDWIPAIRLE